MRTEHIQHTLTHTFSLATTDTIITTSGMPVTLWSNGAAAHKGEVKGIIFTLFAVTKLICYVLFLKNLQLYFVHISYSISRE